MEYLNHCAWRYLTHGVGALLVSLHGRVGATTSVVVWGTLAALVIGIVASGAAY